MIKRICLVVLSMISVNASSQFSIAVLKNNCLLLQNDSVVLVPDLRLRGILQWQETSDSVYWTDIQSTNGDTLSFEPHENKSYRLKITEEDCDPIFGDTVKVYKKGTTISEYLAAGITLLELNNAGVSTAQLFNSGISVSELLNSGFSINSLFEGGIMVGTLSQGGIDSLQLEEAGLIGSVSDIESNTYEWVKIGNQIWMAENLKTSKYSNGEPIPHVKNEKDQVGNFLWGQLTTPAFCRYNNDSVAYYNLYGNLYNAYAVMTQKICPSGWHVPSDQEWQTMIGFLGGKMIAGGKMKEIGKVHWWNPNTGATNESGFNALPGGDRLANGAFGNDIGANGLWWSSTYSGTNPYCIILASFLESTTRTSNNSRYGYSVRCIMNE